MRCRFQDAFGSCWVQFSPAAEKVQVRPPSPLSASNLRRSVKKRSRTLQRKTNVLRGAQRISSREHSRMLFKEIHQLLKRAGVECVGERLDEGQASTLSCIRFGASVCKMRSNSSFLDLRLQGVNVTPHLAALVCIRCFSNVWLFQFLQVFDCKRLMSCAALSCIWFGPDEFENCFVINAKTPSAPLVLQRLCAWGTLSACALQRPGAKKGFGLFFILCC